MKEITIVVRRERVDRVLHALQAAGIGRLHLWHVHVLGAGMDPTDSRVSLEEASRYTEEARIELLCRDADVDRVLEVVRSHAATGERGDGVIAVTPLERIVSVRTGEEGEPVLAPSARAGEGPHRRRPE